MHPAWQRLLELAEPYRQAFAHAALAPQAAQQHFLRDALVANRDSAIGRRLGFASITTPSAFAARVPIVRYADIEADLAAWRAGSPSLCAEPAVLTQWTSGSTRAAKVIPYSAAGLEGFRHALFPWLADLCRADPTVAAGRAYWALSPAGTGVTGAPPADNDSAYFGAAAPLLVELSAVPIALASLADVDSWRFWTALFLAACADLSLMSIWSPTFLHPLLDTLEQDSERFVDALLHPERQAPPPALATALHDLGPEAHAHAARLRGATLGGRLDTTLLWPQLRRISCWTHGAAARQVPGLAARLPGVAIDSKGLLSTEAAVSLPMHAAADPVAAVNSGFLELLLDDGRCLPLWDWRVGDEGRVLVTTRSGLWRYDGGDRVRVTAAWQALPCLVFLGRDGAAVDLCGEKLDETLVGERLPAGVDSFLAPDAGGRRYCLFLEAGQVSTAQARILAERTDAALVEIMHYRHARKLGQLGPLHPVRVAGLLRRVAECGREIRGTPLATVKIPVLDGDSGWLAWFSTAATEEEG